MKHKTKGILVIDPRLRIFLVVALSVASVCVRDNVMLLVFTGVMGGLCFYRELLEHPCKQWQ